MALFGSVACGVGALLALDRIDRRGDQIAAILLLGSLFFSDLGIPFVAAVTLELALSRNRWSRAYVVAVPTGLWLLWYLGWGHTAQTFISFHNLANVPSYALDGISSSLATLFGLGLAIGDYQSTALDWGRPLLVLAAILAGWRIYRLARPPDRLLATLALLVGFWSLTALNTNPLAPPTAGRYQYIGVIMIVLFAAELARGVRDGSWAIVTIILVAISAALSHGTRVRGAANGVAGI